MVGAGCRAIKFTHLTLTAINIFKAILFKGGLVHCIRVYCRGVYCTVGGFSVKGRVSTDKGMDFEQLGNLYVSWLSAKYEQKYL